jgi:hypothetical protein
VGNVEKLMQAGIIGAGAALSEDDQKLINSLTDQEVSALISIKGKLTADFVQRNLGGGAAGARGAQTMGIVF